MQHDPTRPEDVLKVDAGGDGNGGDDAADALRCLVATKGREIVGVVREGGSAAVRPVNVLFFGEHLKRTHCGVDLVCAAKFFPEFNLKAAIFDWEIDHGGR